VSAADGRVLRTEKLVDHGDPARRWNLVILAEGFREPEMPQFRAACARFIDQLFATPPFNELWCAINIYCVDVASDESGADDPNPCADGDNGSGLSARTFFDATYCTAGLGRLLAGNQALALATAQAAVPQVRATVGIVNSTRYGGAGGGVAWFSTHASASQIGIHELGHSAFHLTDEYTDARDNSTGGEPTAPNATTDTNRATTKWYDLILPATPLPTMSNPNCANSDNRASPVAAGTVGLFEGSDRSRCGAYRPEHDCYMRTLGTPFCAVCRRAIRDVLKPFMPKQLTPSVGVQFSDTLAAAETRRWFTHSWPACWQVHWTAIPRNPGPSGPALEIRVRTERASRELVTYWLDISNRSAASVEFDARFEILSRD
jgi:hypothetical protein